MVEVRDVEPRLVSKLAWRYIENNQLPSLGEETPITLVDKETQDTPTEESLFALAAVHDAVFLLRQGRKVIANQQIDDKRTLFETLRGNVRTLMQPANLKEEIKNRFFSELKSETSPVNLQARQTEEGVKLNWNYYAIHQLGAVSMSHGCPFHTASADPHRKRSPVETFALRIIDTYEQNAA